MSLFLSRRVGTVLLLLLVCSFAVQAFATDVTGSLTDLQGRFVPNATIRLLRRADSTRRETTTDAKGRFSFTRLDGGEYRVTAESPGFAVLTRTITIGDAQQTEDLQFSGLASQNESV